MKDLEGIVQLRGKWVVLENVENPKLARVLHSRLRKDRFAFGHSEGSGYHEVKDHTDKKDERNHTDKHHDNYDAIHNDAHRDYCNTYSDDNHGDNTGHTDRGYSEKPDSGHSEHADYYRR